MAEYINKESAISIFRAKAEMATCTPAQQYFYKAVKMLEALPAADVAPLVPHQRPVPENLSDLLTIIALHPELPIVPMVNSEIVQDDSFSYWLGSWGYARIDQYVISDNRIFFKDSDDPYELMLHFMDPDKLDAMTDEGIAAACDALPWKEAIIVYIETPDG